MKKFFPALYFVFNKNYKNSLSGVISTTVIPTSKIQGKKFI